MMEHAMTTRPELSPSDSRARQTRLREALAELSADRAILVAPEHVQWLTGFRPIR